MAVYEGEGADDKGGSVYVCADAEVEGLDISA